MAAANVVAVRAMRVSRGSGSWVRLGLGGLLVVLLGAAGAGLPAAAAGSHSRAGAPSPAARAGEVVASSGPIRVDGQVLRDDQGRQVVLRGIAVINKDAPFVPDVGPADFARIRSWGFDSIRLGILWAGIMPAPGVIDQHYLDRMATVVEEAGAAGLRVILDMHQDVYGAPWGDGAAAWAGSKWPANAACPNLPIAQLTGSWGTQYLSPDVNCAFTNFWLDGQLQRYYTQAWVAAASTLGRLPAVSGYDLINEPWQGLLPPGVFENGVLYPAQQRWISAIRTVDADAVAFMEPPSWKNVIIATTPPLTIPADAVYAPHLYGPWDDTAALDDTHGLADLNLAYSRLEGLVAQRPLWVGEWGTVASDPTSVEFAGHVMDLLDRARLGGSYWAYSLGGGYSPFNADGSARPLAAVVAHGHPEAVAGDLTSTSWDVGARRLVVTWNQPGKVGGSPSTSVPSLLAVPAARYSAGVTVTGATRWTYDAADGVVTVWTKPGAVTVTVAPGP